MDQIQLGDKVRDIVSGFTGIAASRAEYLSGYVSFGVQGMAGPDGKMPAMEYFQESMLRIVQKSAVAV